MIEHFCIHQSESVTPESKTGRFCLEKLAYGIVPDCRFNTQEEAEAARGEPYHCWCEPIVAKR